MSRMRTGSEAYYQEPANFVQSIAVDPESWPRMYPEFELPEDQKKAWFGNRIGAVIGVDLAKRLELEIRRSDTRSISPFTAEGRHARGNSRSTAFTMRRNEGVDKTQFFFHWDYLNEALRNIPGCSNIVGWYIFRVADPSTSDQLARRIDHAVRQLAGRDEDGDGEGIRLRFCETDRRHRRDHDGDRRAS